MTPTIIPNVGNSAQLTDQALANNRENSPSVKSYYTIQHSSRARLRHSNF